METPLSKAAQKIMREREAERNQEQPPEAPIIALDPLAAAKASIRMDGRTGIARTLTSNVVPDPLQPRKAKNIDVEEIGRLAGSLKADKQIQPIVVEWKPELSKWMIVVGERRWLATIAAGIEMIACKFIFEPLSPGQRLKMQMGENLHRKDFTDMERAEGFKRLMDLNGWTQQECAAEMRLSQASVSQALKLLELPSPIQADIVAGRIPATVGAKIAQLDDPEEQQEVAEKIVNEGLKGARAKAAVKDKKTAKKKGRAVKASKKFTGRTAGGNSVTVESRRALTDEQIDADLQEILDGRREKRGAA